MIHTYTLLQMFHGYKLNDMHAAMHILLCSASIISKLYTTQNELRIFVNIWI